MRCEEPVLCRVRIAALQAGLQHRLNRNSEYFQLLPNVLLGHFLAETLDHESTAQVLRQAVGVESHIIADQ